MITPFRLWISAILLTVLGLLAPVETFSMVGSAMAQDDAAADSAFDDIRADYRRLRDSLQAAGGVSDAEQPLIRDLLRRSEDFAAANPGHRGAFATSIQLASWLEDDERVFELFEQIVEQYPDDEYLRRAWVRSAGPDGIDKQERVYEKLIELTGGEDSIVVQYARFLNSQSRYERTIELIENMAYDPSELPRAALALADAFFCENKFVEALSTLETVPATVLTDDQAIADEVAQQQPMFEDAMTAWADELVLRAAEKTADDLPRAEIITSRGRVVIELFEDQAPNTVANFITLAEQEFWVGTKFHRVLPNFMAQCGCPNSKDGSTISPGSGNAGYNIPDEIDRDDHRKHFFGTVAMANTGPANTGSSQFYFCHKPTSWLDGVHTVFGRVIDGIELVRAFEQDDVIEEVNILRKRDHAYEAQTIPLRQLPNLGELGSGNTDGGGADSGANDG